MASTADAQHCAVKTEWWGAGVIVFSGAKCILAYGPADATATHSLRLVLTFWYRLTRVVLENGPLNVCVCVCVCVCLSTSTLLK